MAQNQQSVSNQMPISEKQSQQTEPSILADSVTNASSSNKKTHADQKHTHLTYQKTPIEQLSIEIDSDGRKKIVNLNREQQKIYPSLNKFFELDVGSKRDSTEVQKTEKKIQQARQKLKRKFNINTQSPIYNYSVREVLLLGQRYDHILNPKTKETIIYDCHQRKVDLVKAASLQILYSTFVGLSARATWTKLTTKMPVRLFFVTYMTVLSIDAIQNYTFRYKQAVLDHHQQYQNVIRKYESQEKLVY